MKRILVFFDTLRTPAAKPPLILYQLVSAAEMRMPTVPVLVFLAASTPARYAPSWLEVVMFYTVPLESMVGMS